MGQRACSSCSRSGLVSTVAASPAIKRACEWIAGEQGSQSGDSAGKLVMMAAQRFDLSPFEAEFLLRLVHKAKSEGAKPACFDI
ncbi:hypothetical protein [Desulfobotulus mexicanus]|uniref:Uncharacterized protein n=1 Tax=Desulfobotulus mexicanus TaxID=2586642 RepID=A0A5Q4VG56_9BACT|nr:hypothetical protein [Desulfobotulus mexicanus]TYT74981.1 hypothetical protein FIM25_07625 [Desulfobotulus mexicanus]